MCSLEDFDDYKESDRHGLYALFLKEGCKLSPFFKEEWCKKIKDQMKKYNCPNLLYIGKTSKLKTRINKHKKGRIRYSTVRFTMSYCAGMQLYGCQGYDINDKRKITPEDRRKLTEWLEKNTYFKIFETEDCKTREKEYIKKYCPALNIDDNPHPILTDAERKENHIDLPPDEFKKL